MKKYYSAAYRYSYIQLAFHYYMYCESTADQPVVQGHAEKHARKFRDLVRAFLDGKDCIDELSGLRRDLTKDMEIISAYADCFQNYEYVLNRMERRFFSLPPITETEEQMADKLTRFILEEEDPVARRERLQSVLGQLPVQMTKDKFFSVVREQLTRYEGGSKKSLSLMLYLLRTETMVSLPDNMEEGFEELYTFLSQLRKIEFKNLEQTDYEQAVEGIRIAGKILEDLSDQVHSLQEMANHLYVMILCQEYAVMDLEERENLEIIVKKLLNGFSDGNTDDMGGDIESCLTFLEGRQELLYEKLCRQDLQKDCEDLAKKVEKLLSGSLFVSLEPDAEDILETADKSYVNHQLDLFEQELRKSFSSMEKPLVRGIMARALSRVQIQFRDVAELKQYMISSLRGCANSYEQETVMELMGFLMERSYEVV